MRESEIERHCVRCGSRFRYVYAGGRFRLWCSAKCKAATVHDRAHPVFEHVCPQCGRPFRRRGGRRIVHCSRACIKLTANARRRQRR
jgi:endogenous inhibitor of DNA gyrase (YacG/DUF329 family)